MIRFLKWPLSKEKVVWFVFLLIIVKHSPQLSVDEIAEVVSTWQAQCQELGMTYRWVQVFENKGAMMGCSNPHPHGQIWSQQQLPHVSE